LQYGFNATGVGPIISSVLENFSDGSYVLAGVSERELFILLRSALFCDVT